MRRQNFRDQRFEFFHHGVGDFAAFFFGERFLQGAALIHGGGGDDAAFVRDFLESGKFAGGKLHENPPMDADEDECGGTDNCKPQAEGKRRRTSDFGASGFRVPEV